MEPELYRLRAQVDRVEWRAVGRRRIVFELLRRYAPGWPAARSLDVGCGSGVLVEEMAGVCEAYGVDPSPHAVAACRARALKGVVRGPENGSLPFADGSFEVVTAIDVVEHAADDLALLTEMRRVLSERGVAVVIVPAHRALWSTRDVRLHHHRRYSWDGLMRVVKGAGFRIRHATFLDAFLLLPLWLACHTARRGPDGVPDLATDTVLPPPWLNTLLVRWMSVEGRWARSRRLPAGVSIAVVAEREAQNGGAVGG